MQKILIIDDNAPMRESLREALNRSGYSVLEAEDGNIGAELYRREIPDLVITDLIMPDKDGAEFIFEIQKEFPDIKIIAITGGQGDVQEYLKSVAAYSQIKYTFEKPFPMEKMIKAIKNTLE